MLRFLFYLFLSYFIFYLVRYIVRVYKSSVKNNKSSVKPPVEARKNSDIDKNKIIDAQYEEL